MPIIILSDKDRDTISSLLRGEVAELNDDGAGTYRRLAELFEKAPSRTVLERYEDLLFAQRAGKLTPAQDNELSQLEGGLCARLPARTELEQDLAFFAKLLREREEKKEK